MKNHYYVLLIFLVCGFQSFGQESRIVTGTITEVDTGMPLMGTTILEKGTNNGVVADFDGAYSIEVPENAVLVFSMIGFERQEISVNGRTTIDLSLVTDVAALDEVVVTALGIKRNPRSLGYAVSEISSEEIAESGNTNFASALYGKAAGVKVTTAPGGASSAVNVQIRGVNSLNYDQQPLYVVDGVVIRNDQQSGAGGANNNNYWDDQRIRGNGILDINPNDIETISILKGASASALYGSDAASGVVVITTKSGRRAGKGLGVEFNYSGSIEEVAFLPKFQNIYGPGYDRETNLAVGANEEGWIPDTNSPTGFRPNFRAYGSFGPRMEGQEVLWWDGSVRSYSAREDNYKDVYRTGYSSNMNVAISESTEKFNYRFTASRLDYQATQEGSEQEKNTFGLNSSLNLNDDISLDITANYINTITFNRPHLLGQVLGSFGGYFSRAEDMGLMKEKFRTSDGYKYVTYANPERSDEAFIHNIRATNLLDFFWQQKQNEYVETENRLISSATLNWDFTDNLVLRGRIGSDYTGYNSENKQYTEYPVEFNPSSSSTGSFSVNSGHYSILYGDVLLSYSDVIEDDFTLGVSGGFQSRSENYKDQASGTTSGLVTENWFSLNNSYGILSTSYNRGELLKYAFLGIANVSYKDFLYLEGTARQEYASTLPSGNNTYFYPSVNGGLVFNEILSLPEVFNYGKLRGSYGVVGNAPPRYESNIAYNQTSLQTVNGSVPALTLDNSYGNANISPEMKYETEVGLELAFFNSRLNLDVSYYTNEVRDQILGLQTAASVGATSQLVNVGEIGSEGFELAIDATPIFNKNFRWDTRFNFAINETRVNALMEGVDELIFFTAEQNAIKIVAGVGERLGNIYVNPRATDENGNFLINEDGLYVIDNSTYVKAGNIMPKAVGGFSNTLSYKGLSLDFSIDYRLGGQMVSPPTKYMRGAGFFENTLQYRDAEHGGKSYTVDGVTYNDGVLLEGVNQNTGESNTQVIDAGTYYLNTFGWGSNAWNSEGAIYDNSYVKLREAVLSYNLPDSFNEKIGVNRLRVSLIGRNLFYLWRTLENIDPEAPVGNRWWSQGVDLGSTAPSRSIGISLNASF